MDARLKRRHLRLPRSTRSCGSRGTATWLVAAAFLAMVNTALADESVLPLSVGNGWRYECQHVQVGYEHAGEYICDRANPQSAERAVSVVDSVAVRHSVKGLLPVVPPAEDAMDSEVYYLLEGDAVSLFVSSSQLECAGLGPGAEADKMLVRVGPEADHSSQRGERVQRSAAVSEGVWIRGVGVVDMWWLFEEEYLLWDISSPPDVLYSSLMAENCLDMSFSREETPADLGADWISVNGFPVDIVIWAAAPDGMTGRYRLGLSAGVGIVRISEYVLVEATIHGETIRQPTCIEPALWGGAKMRQLEARP